MFRFRRIAVLSLALLAAFARQSQQPEVQMLFASDYFPNQITAATGETWYGLFPRGDGWELAETRIRVEPLNAGCIENGRRVTVNRSTHPLFLVRGRPQFRPGAVPTATGPDVRLNPPAIRDLRLGERAFRLVATGDTKNYELRFVRVADGHSQQIVAFHSPDSTMKIAWPPRIIWIGDLDRDGQPDLFADIHMFETPGDWVLYLSSAARAGELFHKVAEFQGEDC